MTPFTLQFTLVTGVISQRSLPQNEQCDFTPFTNVGPSERCDLTLGSLM